MNTRMCIASILVGAGVGIGSAAWAQTMPVDERALTAAMAAAARAVEAAQLAPVTASAQAVLEKALVEAARAAELGQAAPVTASAQARREYSVAEAYAARSLVTGALGVDIQAISASARDLAQSAFEMQQGVRGFAVAGSQARTREQVLYTQATSSMDESHWDRALELFAQVIALKGERLDGAIYWKAYIQNKLGQRPEALATVQELLKSQPNSRWISDAKALEVEIRGASGQPVKPEAESDDDLKLLALNGLLNADPEQATVILQKLLQGPQSRKVKQRALFVLSQSKSPKSREILISVAKGSSNPDLQREAINYLGITRSKENRQVLAEIYASNADKEVKRRILQAFMMAGDSDQLLTAARAETDVALRIEAIRQLGMMHATGPLSEVFATEVNAEVKRELMRAFMMAGDAERVSQIARGDADQKLRIEAVRNLGMMGREKTAAALVELYAVPTQAPEVRKAIISALFTQGNAKAMVDIARKETNPELRKQLVQHLSMMKSKEATDFMMEIINK